jgi:hypothetical protein
MEPAKKKMKVQADGLTRAYEEKALPYVAGIKAQVRDVRTGKLRHERLVKKPTSAGVKRGKARAAKRYAEKYGNPGHGTKKKPAKKAPPIDQHAVRELNLYAENDYGLYQRQLAIDRNQKRHWDKGRWTLEKSTKGYMHLADEAARKYVREFGGTVRSVFPKPVREAVAKIYAKDFQDRAKAGEDFD